MKEHIEKLAIGHSYAHTELHNWRFPNSSYEELDKALYDLQGKTFKAMSNALNVVADLQAGCHWHPNGGCDHDRRRYEVYTHNRMSMKTSTQMDVQIIVSVMRTR